MELKVFREGDQVTVKAFPDVPERGLFIIKSDEEAEKPSSKQKTLKEMEIEGLSDEEIAALEAGDSSVIESHIEPGPNTRPGEESRFVGCIGQGMVWPAVEIEPIPEYEEISSDEYEERLRKAGYYEIHSNPSNMYRVPIEMFWEFNAPDLLAGESKRTSL